MIKVSAVVTTFNNSRTLATCLESVCWAAEIVVLDSFSHDETLAIAQRYGAQIYQNAFLGYGRQKQMAVDKARYDWVLLLDADEALSPALQQEVCHLLAHSHLEADGYELLRQEQSFWKMCSPRVTGNYFLRLFDRRKGKLSDMPIHAAPKIQGKAGRLREPFYHYGETSIHVKVDKINAYSTGLVPDKIAKGQRGNPLIMVFYPFFVFFRNYIIKRNFLNGWAGFINSVIMAFYSFLKYAKLYEHYQFEKYGNRLMPEGAPDLYQATTSHSAQP